MSFRLKSLSFLLVFFSLRRSISNLISSSVSSFGSELFLALFITFSLDLIWTCSLNEICIFDEFSSCELNKTSSSTSLSDNLNSLFVSL